MAGTVRTSGSSARTIGRRVALGAYYCVVVAISVACAVQITLQVFFQPSPRPFATCREGLQALHKAVARAREAAAGTEGQDQALARFRSAIEPDWSYRDGVASICRGSPKDEGALDAIERLRYAEEHAARREAGDLAPLRRRVQAIVDGEFAPPPPSPGPAGR
jgi:hypothetical protein